MFSLRNNSRRRIIVVAYVGKDYKKYIPYPKGVKIYCWPQAGGTNPYAVRQLIDDGAEVKFVDKLHTKLFWVEGIGAVITSANLTNNALSSGGLTEFGIFVDSNEININRVLRELTAKEPTENDLDKLEVEHRLYQRSRPKLPHFPRRGSGIPVKMSYNSKWKFGWWDEYGSLPKKIRKYVRKEYDTRVADWIPCRKDEYAVGDLVLTFFLDEKAAKKSGRNQPAKHFGWLCVDAVLPIKVNPGYPYTAVQFKDKPKFEEPHKLTPAFKRKFKKALKSPYNSKKNWAKYIKDAKDSEVPREFLKEFN